MPGIHRHRRTLHFPIWTSVVLMTINVTLLVLWIVLLVLDKLPGAITIGVIAFALSLFGIAFYLSLAIKEIRLNRRQANFVDSVTHELKTPIAALQLYLETIQLRELDRGQQLEFCDVMETELQRLDRLINQLLEVGRLDAIGQDSEPEEVKLIPLLRHCAESACARHKCSPDDVFVFDCEPATVHARRMLLEMIFGNLMDNAVKYAGAQPEVQVALRLQDRGRAIIRVIDNGDGVPSDMRKHIFNLFYRGGNELQRSTRGTGLGLYIVRKLVHILGGRINVIDCADGPGSVFEVELPGAESAQITDTATIGDASRTSAAQPVLHDA